jgi:hypothetical protein
MLPELVGKVLGAFKNWPHGWWMLQVIGCVAIFANNILAKIYGLNAWTYGWCVFMAVLITGWAFTYSYQIAPSFLAPWFIAQGVLALFGFIGSLVIFDGLSVSVSQIIGALLTIVGSYLLIK